MVDTARLYSVPDRPPPVFMSGFGAKAVKLAARIADGYMSTMPNAGFVRLYRESGGGDAAGSRSGGEDAIDPPVGP
jgi:alkanesulfonate monooxygenase SsuD/methylene tetrahydromethanopterin reductase-like flavin-dependent oxidoreductase (luciferase family)